MNQAEFNELKKQSVKNRFDNYKIRQTRLKKMKLWILQHQVDVLKALSTDFNKPQFETQITEILPVLSEIKFFAQNLKTWMEDQKVPTPLTLLGHRSSIRYENKGVVLIISPWNYPFQLAVIPLIAAISAGNTVVLKPSELTSATSNLMFQMITDCFPKDQVLVVQGDKSATENLLTYSFDHVFFTGSTAVGRIIAKACADKLIPVTLELGGKSPTIIDKSADIKTAAQKIFWGKFLNRGQTCVAPDYVLVHETCKASFISHLNTLAALHKKDLEGRIVTTKHDQRLKDMSLSQESFNLEVLKLVEVTSNADASMKEEIFGPVLPVIGFSDDADIERTISQYEKPLALYIFSKDRKFIETNLRKFSSGGVGINSVIVHLGNHHLPFGGVGASGMGRYHGYYGFLELSHHRAIIEQRWFHFLSNIMYPPYSAFKRNSVRILLRLQK